MIPNDPLAELYDIEGIDAISVWPLAIGWWLVLVAIVLLIAGALIIYWRKQVFARSWHNSALQALSKIEGDIANREIVFALSPLIRRIAIHRYSRKVCAGLAGKDWLRWLKKHDPQQFDWEEKAPWLANAPYAPPEQSIPETKIPEADIKATIEAIRRWIK